MKRMAGAVLTLLMNWNALAQTPAEDPYGGKRVLTVCVETKTPTYQAEQIASTIFASIGIELNWTRPGRDCPDEALRMSLTEETPPTLLPGALAYAKPFEGTEIRIFMDRVIRACDAPANLCGRILGHVMAHEIAHMAQGVSRHSREGMMKARWNASDFAAMRVALIPFNSLDVILIYNGIDARAGRTVPTLTH